MRIKQHDDLVLTVRCQQAQETEAVRQVVSDLASDLHIALDRRGLPSTVVVISRDGTHDKVLETFRT